MSSRAVLPVLRAELAVICLLLAGFASIPSTAGRADDRIPLVVKDSEAATETEMKPYTEKIEHTDLKIRMVPIPGGSFVMGTPESEADSKPDERPQHEVQVAPFWMASYEITWAEYEVWGERLDEYRRAAFGTAATPRDKVADAVTRPTPPYTDMSFGMGKRKNPAISMTQHAARTYCKWLSAKTGRYYRLPTEAEWEYACRAGTTTAWSFGDDPALLDEYAWYAGNSDGHYHPVGEKKPNPWGLYDMHGNVAEWVLDQYIPDAYAKRATAQKPAVNPLEIPMTVYPRIVRGGGWDDEPDMLRSGVREGSHEDWKEQDPQIPQSIWYLTDAQGLGFRIVRPLVEPSEEEKASYWDRNEPIQLDPIEADSNLE
ncbi:MAG: formylglycine-generating enzyme family protein [Planctomycetaceae bacterium]|nr:formylglycine-generating enzyme family protein [Planctomycetaceae bacterium]